MEWPIVYLAQGRVDELMFISYDDWYHDVDTHWAIGNIKGEDFHYVVDSAENVYQLENPYMIEAGRPHLEFRKVNKPELVTELGERAKEWLESTPNNFADLVKKLNY